MGHYLIGCWCRWGWAGAHWSQLWSSLCGAAPGHCRSTSCGVAPVVKPAYTHTDYASQDCFGARVTSKTNSLMTSNTLSMTANATGISTKQCSKAARCMQPISTASGVGQVAGTLTYALRLTLFAQSECSPLCVTVRLPLCWLVWTKWCSRATALGTRPSL